jgi:hypothetical protein
MVERDLVPFHFFDYHGRQPALGATELLSRISVLKMPPVPLRTVGV